MSDDGKCGAHVYPGFTQTKIDAVLAKLTSTGSTVTGSNPWDVDTQQHGVKLRGTWDQPSGNLTIIVTDKSWVVPCSMIWDKLDDLLHHIGGLDDSDVSSS